MDRNPYWDMMLVAAFHRRPVLMIGWLLTDYAVNKLIGIQDALEDKMREAAGCQEDPPQAEGSARRRPKAAPAAGRRQRPPPSCVTIM